MFDTQELTQLNSRKAELVAESDTLRRALLQDCAKLRPAVSWVEGGASFIRRTRPFYLAAAPLLGIWAARRGRPLAGWWRKLSLGWRLWRTAAAVWRNLPADKT